MTNQRLLTLIRCAMDRAVTADKKQDAAQKIGAMLLVQKDVIADLEKENAKLKLEARYGKRRAS